MRSNHRKAPLRAWTSDVIGLLLLAFLAATGCGRKEKPASSQRSNGAKSSPAVGVSAAEQPATDREVTSVSLAGDFPPLAALPEVPVPADNPLSDVKVKLGKLLFFDDIEEGSIGWG